MFDKTLTTSVALVVAMVEVSLSLATKISYAEEQTLTESGVTVTGDFDKPITKLTVKDWTNAAPHDNETYDSLKGYIEESYKELKALELDVSPMDAKNTSEIATTFTRPPAKLYKINFEVVIFTGFTEFLPLQWHVRIFTF